MRGAIVVGNKGRADKFEFDAPVSTSRARPFAPRSTALRGVFCVAESSLPPAREPSGLAVGLRYDPVVSKMRDLTELKAKLDRTQADVERGVGYLVKQRALVVHWLAEGKDATESREMLEALETTQLIHVQHRDRLRRELDAALAGKGPSLEGLRRLKFLS